LKLCGARVTGLAAPTAQVMLLPTSGSYNWSNWWEYYFRTILHIFIVVLFCARSSFHSCYLHLVPLLPSGYCHKCWFLCFLSPIILSPSRWLASPSAFTPFLFWIACCLLAAQLSFVCPRAMSRFIVCHSTGFFNEEYKVFPFIFPFTQRSYILSCHPSRLLIFLVSWSKYASTLIFVSTGGFFWYCVKVGNFINIGLFSLPFSILTT